MQRTSDRRFVLVSGLPASGKSQLARQLAPLLELALIDKDHILEELFDSRGVDAAKPDAAERRTLSRKSDLILQQQAEASTGAILVSFWRLDGMPPESGTSVDWVRELSARIVNLHCECPAEIAAARFCARNRHPGHQDRARSPEQILQSICDIERFEPLRIGVRVSVDTSGALNPRSVAAQVTSAFAALT